MNPLCVAIFGLLAGSAVGDSSFQSSGFHSGGQQTNAAPASNYAAGGNGQLGNYGSSNGGGFNNHQPAYNSVNQELAALQANIPGVPGEDYPIFSDVPETGFTCDGQIPGGYYADPEAECQVFHICTDDGLGGLTTNSFLCPNGTIFNQQYFICDWWFNFDCAEAESLYSINDAIAAERAEIDAAAAAQNSYGAGSAGSSYSGPSSGQAQYGDAQRAGKQFSG